MEYEDVRESLSVSHYLNIDRCGPGFSVINFPERNKIAAINFDIYQQWFLSNTYKKF